MRVANFNREGRRFFLTAKDAKKEKAKALATK
jgi:hypothetical protein